MKYISRQKGFTLIEMLVAATLFVVVASATSTLFVYTLRINRRGQALRQASQSMLNFVEFLVKEVRNGQIDYGFVDPGGTSQSSLPKPCFPSSGTLTPGSPSYQSQDNKIGILNTDGTEECIYLAYGPGAAGTEGDWVGDNVFGSNSSNPSPILALQKGDVVGYNSLTPPNSRVDYFMVLVRPLSDPYYTLGGSLVAEQPFVTIIAKFTVQLSTGEQVPIYYQTSVSTNKYDVPGN